MIFMHNYYLNIFWPTIDHRAIFHRFYVFMILHFGCFTINHHVYIFTFFYLFQSIYSTKALIKPDRIFTILSTTPTHYICILLLEKPLEADYACMAVKYMHHYTTCIITHQPKSETYAHVEPCHSQPQPQMSWDHLYSTVRLPAGLKMMYSKQDAVKVTLNTRKRQSR